MAPCMQMPFTYGAYRDMLRALKTQGYAFCGYEDWRDVEKSVILRHDIDFDTAAALEMAELEVREGVKSTYFALLRTGFYNPFERNCTEHLRRIVGLGHDVGLHFDETQYDEGENMPAAIEREAAALSGILEVPVRCVSMHRPSNVALEADWDVPGIVNSYSKELFHSFEYVSDSHRHWRKPVLDLIRSNECSHLHILTHPFWYGEIEASLKESLDRFSKRARAERVTFLDSNFTNLDEALDPACVMASRVTLLQGVRLRTDRLVLRSLRLDDAPDMFEYTSEPEVSQFLNWHPHRETEEAKSWIASKLARAEVDDLLLGMELRESSKLIGTVRAYHFDAVTSSCEISYALNPLYQGCGYMGEALRCLVDTCFEAVGVKRVVACIDCKNAASVHVACRLGMERVSGGDFFTSIKGEERLQHTYSLKRRLQ